MAGASALPPPPSAPAPFPSLGPPRCFFALPFFGLRVPPASSAAAACCSCSLCSSCVWGVQCGVQGGREVNIVHLGLLAAARRQVRKSLHNLPQHNMQHSHPEHMHMRSSVDPAPTSLHRCGRAPLITIYRTHTRGMSHMHTNLTHLPYCGRHPCNKGQPKGPAKGASHAHTNTQHTCTVMGGFRAACCCTCPAAACRSCGGNSDRCVRACGFVL